MKKTLPITTIGLKSKDELTEFDNKQLKAFILNLSNTYDPKTILEQFRRALLTGTINEEVEQKYGAALYAFESDAHMMLLESFSERFRITIKVVCKQIIDDFGCKTNSEKIMAETAAVAFGRYVDASRRLNNVFDVDNTITLNKTAYMVMLSKERDRAHRQYLSTVSMIKQLKAPIVEMNIKAHTAFVSHNQQINVPQTSKENNEAK